MELHTETYLDKFFNPARELAVEIKSKLLVMGGIKKQLWRLNLH